MRRDLAVAVLLGLLLVLVLPSTGLGGVGPTAPAAYLALALLLTGFFVSVVGAGTGRPLALLVAALPFVAYGVLEAPALAGLRPVPAIPFWVVVIAGLVLAGVGRRARTPAVAVLLTVLAGGVLLGRVPATLTAWFGGDPAEVLEARADEADRPGVRPGAPVPAPSTALGAGPGPFLVPATRGEQPPDVPVVLVFGAGSAPTGHDAGPGVFLDGAGLPDAVSPIELDPYDAAIVLPGAWPEANGRWSPLARALAVYARRGGLLVGPAPGRAWPPPLGQELGAAGRGWVSGLEGAQPYGLGLVVRAASEAGIREVLADAAHRRRVGTVFDAVGAPAPALPAALERWRDHPAHRRPQGLLLAVYVVVAVLLDRLLRGAVPRVLGLVAPALAVALGLVWTSPGDPGLRAHALAFELGGGGGRRLEAVALSSGPAGWVGTCRYREGGFLRLEGAHVGPDGRVRVGPGRTAWLLREAVARGSAAPEPEAREAGFLRGLLRGDVDPARLRLGRGGPLAVEIAGVEVPETWILRLR